MAKCFYCGEETVLYIGAKPVCIECDIKRIYELERKPITEPEKAGE